MGWILRKPSVAQSPPHAPPTVPAVSGQLLATAAVLEGRHPSTFHLLQGQPPTANHQAQLPTAANPAGLSEEPIFSNLCGACFRLFKKERPGKATDVPWSRETPVTVGSRSRSGTLEIIPAIGSGSISRSGTLEIPAGGARRGEAALEGRQREEGAPAAEEAGQPREVPLAETSRGGVRAGRGPSVAAGSTVAAGPSLADRRPEGPFLAAEDLAAAGTSRDAGDDSSPPTLLPPSPPPPPRPPPLRRPRRRESYDDVPAELGGVPVYRGSDSRREGTR